MTRATGARSFLIPGAVFAYVLISFALHPYSPFYTHHPADPDDFMRLDQVAAWLHGQGWYDLSVPRMSPGGDTVVHWSRLIDLPIALIALPFTAAFGVTDALMIAALIVPLLWFGLLLGVVTALGRTAGDRSGLACLFILSAPQLSFNYAPSRVDHHGAQAVIAGFGLLCLSRILHGDRARRHAALAALACAGGFWIGAEALPWAIMLIACLGIAAAWRGGDTARDAAWFGFCLPLCVALTLPLALPPAQYASLALSWFSPAYLLFALLAGGILMVGWAAGRHLVSPPARLALYAALALAAAAVFFALIPAALHGPFADYDAFDATTALDNISEARPLAKALHVSRFSPRSFVAAGLVFARYLALPLAALAACLLAARRSRAAARLFWLAQALYLIAAAALTLFWQLRVGLFMQLFMLVPLAWLLRQAWHKLARRLQGRALFAAELSALLLLGPLPVIGLPAIATGQPVYPDLLLFPAARGPAPCSLAPVIARLNELTPAGSPPLTIMNPADSGPELLYATRDKVVAGNFDVPGNRDAYDFFHATDDNVARQAAARWHADLALACKTAPSLYLGKGYYDLRHVELQAGTDGLLRLVNTDQAQPLIERLLRGTAPPWLQPVAVPDGGDYLLFKIQPYK